MDEIDKKLDILIEGVNKIISNPVAPVAPVAPVLPILPIKDNLFKYLPLLLSTITTTAISVFWVMNYVNSPVNKIQLELTSMKDDMSAITQSHIDYGVVSDRESKDISDINTNLARITQALIDKGILK